MRQQVFELYAKGTYIWQIAETLNITEAEVVAILGL